MHGLARRGAQSPAKMNEIKALVSGASKAHITVSHEGIDLHEDILKFYEACMTDPDWTPAMRYQLACVRILVCVCCALLSLSLSLSLSRLVWEKGGLLSHFPCVCVARVLFSLSLSRLVWEDGYSLSLFFSAARAALLSIPGSGRTDLHFALDS